MRVRRYTRRTAHDLGVGNNHLLNFSEPLQFPFDFQPSRLYFNYQDRTPGNGDDVYAGVRLKRTSHLPREDTGSSRTPSASNRR